MATWAQRQRKFRRLLKLTLRSFVKEGMDCLLTQYQWSFLRLHEQPRGAGDKKE